MSPKAIILTFASLILGATASPVDSSLSFNPGGPEQPCTTSIDKLPSFETDCTFTCETATATASVECGGCVLETKILGLGLHCQTSTTVPGTTTTTTTVCAADSVTAPALRRDTTASSSACTKTILPTFGALSSSTCTFYDTFVTTTVSEDCGGYPGCVVATVGAHGPAVQCGAKVTLPTGTVTATTCTA